jgi:hypothetical protein
MAIDDGSDWVPLACTLPAVERPVRVAEFDDFFTSLRRLDRWAPTRLDVAVPRDAEGTGRDLADRESGCCSFFTFEFEPAGPELVIHISVPPDHVEVLDALQARAAVSAHGRRR